MANKLSHRGKTAAADIYNYSTSHDHLGASAIMLTLGKLTVGSLKAAQVICHEKIKILARELGTQQQRRSSSMSGIKGCFMCNNITWKITAVHGKRLPRL